jgi:hypothetical protein
MSQEKNLTIGLHSDSIDEAIRKDKEVVDVLFECSKLNEFDFIATPTESPILSKLNPKVTRISYENKGNSRFVAHMQKEGIDQGWVGFHDLFNGKFYSDIFGCREGTSEFEKVKTGFHDLLAFESITEWGKGDAVFVTQLSQLLENNVWIQRRFKVKILSFVQALEYMDLDLKRRNIYYASPHIRETDGRAFHYWFLLRQLIPSFADAWKVSVYGEKVILNGTEIKDVLSGLADRLENAFCASDKIAMEFMKRPINSTEWEILYNFNYFCLLATGVFDALAWLTVHRYSIPIKSHLDVSIQITGPKSRGAKFVNVISKKNAPLSSFIQNNENLVKLFYPMRHSVQHKEPVGGAQFEDANEGWTASVARIKSDAIAGIQKLDRLGHPFSEWGLLDTGMGGLKLSWTGFLEPYRFTRKALRELFAFSNEYLNLLDFPSLITSELKEKVASAKSKDSETCFIAKIYWKRATNLPLLFRSVH